MIVEKQLLLDEMHEKLTQSKGFLITRYGDFNANRSREFRDVVAEAGELKVVRKRVFIKAAEKQGIKLSVADLQGHIGIVFIHDDATKMCKKVVGYGEKTENAVAVLGGFIDGAVCSGEDIQAIATLPSLEEMRSQFLGLLEAPMSHTVGTIQAVLTSILYCLEEKGKQEQI